MASLWPAAEDPASDGKAPRVLWLPLDGQKTLNGGSAMPRALASSDTCMTLQWKCPLWPNQWQLVMECSLSDHRVTEPAPCGLEPKCLLYTKAVVNEPRHL